MTFGEQIKAYRVAHPDKNGKIMSQRKLGEILDKDSTVISCWERGKKAPQRYAQMGILATLDAAEMVTRVFKVLDEEAD